MKLYSKHSDFRFLALTGKRPRDPGHWNPSSYAEAKRRISTGGNAGFLIPENMIVIDVDPRNGGLESYNRLLDDLGTPDLCSIYPTVITGGGGLHIYAGCKRSHDTIKSTNPDYPGIDIKKRGGYVVAAGSIHPDTKKPYEVYNDVDRIIEIVPTFFDLYSKPKRPANLPLPEDMIEASCEELGGYLSQLDVLDYASNDSWFRIMCAAHNATGGAGIDEFLTWSLNDPRYSGHEQEIRARWNSIRADVPNPITLGTIVREVIGKTEKNVSDCFDELPKLPDDPTEPKGLVKLDIKKARDDLSFGYVNKADLPHEIARRVLEDHTLISGSDQRFWKYTGKFWRPVGRNVISNYVLKAYSDMGEVKSLSSVLSATIGVLEAMTARDTTPGSEYPAGYSIINVLNGELWLDDTTGAAELKKHSPDSMLVNCLPIHYDPNANAPRFLRFLSEIFAPEEAQYRESVISHLIEILGYTIQARKNIATWVLFHGRGANGKTVLLSIMSALLGEAALEKPIGTISTERNNHALADLPGKLAIIDDDVSSSTILPDGELKRLSENKYMTANPKNAMPYRFRSIAIPILSANSFPVAKDLSDGLRRRAQVFPFRRTFSPEDQDSNLTDYIVLNELSGVLNILLEGLCRLRARGMFTAPVPCIKARDQWYAANNTIVDFVQTRLLVDTKAAKPKEFNLYWLDYKNYCIDCGVSRPLTRGGFRYALESAGVRIVTTGKGQFVVGYTLKKIG